MRETKVMQFTSLLFFQSLLIQARIQNTHNEAVNSLSCLSHAAFSGAEY